MANLDKALVAGTTADYIDLLAGRFPGDLVFLTDIPEREKAGRISRDGVLELTADLKNEKGALSRLKAYLDSGKFTLRGVVCFDCESLALTSAIAEAFDLPFPSRKAVLNCRSKYVCKRLWNASGILAPQAVLVGSEKSALEYFYSLGEEVVLKPLSGSGSELTFLCDTTDSVRASYRLMEERLRAPANIRMYDPGSSETVVMEQYIGGEEYSCDFVFENNRVWIIRLTKKIVHDADGFGTALGYIVPAELPQGWNAGHIENRLLEAAQSLGLERAVVMADFKFHDGEMFLLEMTPRMGGDCLPFLIETSSGLDMFRLVIDFSQGKKIDIPAGNQWRRAVGLRLLAGKPGIIKNLDTSLILSDNRVLQCHVSRVPGQRIDLPPLDYDSRVLGYVIFMPFDGIDIEKQCEELTKKLRLETEEALVG